MKQLGLLIILAAPLLFGQMCGTTGPVQQEDSRIAAGVYTGPITCSAKYESPYQSQTNSSQYSYSVAISDNGIPIDSSGAEYHVGSLRQDTQGITTTTTQTTQLLVDGGHVVVHSKASLVYDYTDLPDGIFSGSQVEEYSQVADSALDYNAALVVTSTDDGSTTITIQCLGTLTR